MKVISLLQDKNLDGQSTELHLEDLNVSLDNHYTVSSTPRHYYEDDDYSYKLVLTPTFIKQHEDKDEEHEVRIVLFLNARAGQLIIDRSKSRVEYFGDLGEETDRCFLEIENYEVIGKIKLNQ